MIEMNIQRNGVISFMKKNTEIIAIILILFSGCAPWFIWGYIPTIYVGIIGGCLLLLTSLVKIKNELEIKNVYEIKNVFKTKVKSVFNDGRQTNIALALLLYFFYFILFQLVRWGDLFGSSIYLIVALILVVGVTDDTKKIAYDKFSKVMGMMVLISLVAWLTHKYVFEIPTISVFDVSATKGQVAGTTLMKNHFFFVTYFDRTDRFYGVFDEPGVLGTIGALLLYVNRYDFRKWYNIALLAGGIPTLSLAFYLLTIIGMFFVYSRKIISMFLVHSRKARDIIVSVLIIVIVGLAAYFVLWNNAEFQQHIVHRLSSSDGILSLINDREVQYIRDNFNTMLEHPLTMLFGYGNNSQIGAGTSVSYMRWLLQYGFVGFSVMCFFVMTFLKNFNITTVGFFVLWMLAFSQRPNIFSAAYMVLIVVLVPKLNQLPKPGEK